MARGTGQATTDILLDLKQIYWSATKTDFITVIKNTAVTHESSIGSVPSSPLDADLEPQEVSHLSSSTICMLLDMERILYSCAPDANPGPANMN